MRLAPLRSRTAEPILTSVVYPFTITVAHRLIRKIEAGEFRGDGVPGTKPGYRSPIGERRWTRTMFVLYDNRLPVAPAAAMLSRKSRVVKPRVDRVR